MARVVQQRKSPPYLLIIFVFLFLVSATLAVLFYNNFQKAEKIAQDEKAARKKLADAQDDSKIQGMIRTHDQKIAKREVAPTVVAQLRKEIGDLAQKITGGLSTYEQAMAAAKKAEDDLTAAAEQKKLRATGFAGLGNEVVDLLAKLEARAAEADALQLQLAEKEKELAKSKEELKVIQDDFQAKLAERDTKIQALEGNLKTEHDEYVAKIEKLDQQAKQKESELNSRIATLTQRNQVLQLEVQRKDIQIEKLSNQIRDILRPIKDSDQVVQRPDGKVLRIIEGADRCYVDLGSKNRVVPGMTFTIYPASGIGKEDQGKAVVVLTTVSENVSEGRIVKGKSDDPVVAGDLIANVAFDQNRALTFVVEGDFDLLGTGRATEAGAQAVKDLIQRFGGKVVKTISVETDFVVMGVEPELPPKPGENAELSVHKLYQEKMKLHDNYKNVQEMAMSMHIPVLNAGRFLALVGYTPGKTLED
ncbi:MAG TPA: hypothetical protein PK082_01910 [Phycisphaerae bacterium]|nr:hypothetical protein [Phycisphaerae bacterium]